MLRRGHRKENSKTLLNPEDGSDATFRKQFQKPVNKKAKNKKGVDRETEQFYNVLILTWVCGTKYNVAKYGVFTMNIKLLLQIVYTY